MPSAEGVPTVGDGWRICRELGKTGVGTARLNVEKERMRKKRTYISNRKGIRCQGAEEEAGGVRIFNVI